MGFRTKLVLSYIFLIALITGSFYFFFSYSLQKGMIEESRANLTSQGQLVRLLVMGDKRVTRPQQLAALTGTAIKARVTIIAPDGTVVGDSDVDRRNWRNWKTICSAPRCRRHLKMEAEVPCVIPIRCESRCFTLPRATVKLQLTVSFALPLRWNI